MLSWSLIVTLSRIIEEEEVDNKNKIKLLGLENKDQLAKSITTFKIILQIPYAATRTMEGEGVLW